MKQVFHKIMSFAMAFVVLFSTMSFSVDMHFCGDTLVETAIFHKAKGCGMEMQNPSKKECAITKKNCCSDQQILVDGQNQLQLSVDKLTFEQQVFIASFVYTYINLFKGVEENTNSYGDSSPSLVVRDIYKLDESYLI
jgi:hypothetical protein